MRKRILIICHDRLQSAPRFLMEIEALKNEYELIVAGVEIDETKKYGFKFINIQYKHNYKQINYTFHLRWNSFLRQITSLIIQLLFFKKFKHNKNEASFKQQFEFDTLTTENFDLIIAHHVYTLPTAIMLAEQKRVKIIANLHEYYPLEFEENSYWVKHTQPKYIQLCKECLPKVSAILNVGEIIAKEYKREFGVNSVIITNSKPYMACSPSNTEQNTIKLIHHGIALPSRNLELMIDMMDFLDSNYTLDFMLVESKSDYLLQLKKYAEKNRKINFIPPVNTSDIPCFINKYDIGLYILAPTNFNNLNALPNKFFEFVQANLAIAIGPSPEMADIVKKYDLGVVAEDFSAKSMAEKIKSLSIGQIMNFKNNCHKHAKELSVENNYEIIKNTVKELL